MNATNYESLVLEVTGKLSDKLGTVAPHAWEVMVRQSYVWAWTAIGTWIIAAAGAAFATYWAYFKWKTKDHYEDDLDAPIIISRIVVAAAWMVLFILVVVSLPDVFTAMINPEYRAIMQLIGK